MPHGLHEGRGPDPPYSASADRGLGYGLGLGVWAGYEKKPGIIIMSPTVLPRTVQYGGLACH
jgi:hypothetical protein